MATQSPQSRYQRTAPAKADPPQAVPGHGSDKARGLPFIAPHRLAGLTRDRGMAEALRHPEIERRIRGDRLADQIRSWAIWISLTLMCVAILATAIDRYLDGAL